MDTSVVVTVYNLRRLAPAAIRSALQQTRTAREVIVVDDASTDGSADALEAEFGNRVRLVRLAHNQGVLRATCHGLREATGDVVSFLDGDDVWEAEKIARVVDVFERSPSVVFVSHDQRTIGPDGTVLREDDPLLVQTGKLSRTADASQLSDFMRRSVLEYRGHVWLGSAYSVRRAALDVKAFEKWVDDLPDARSVYQDHPLASFLAVHSEGLFAHVDAKLLRYRLHDSNYSSAPTDLERARTIVRKALATAYATQDLVPQSGTQWGAARAAQAKKVRELEFLVALYQGAYARALWNFGSRLGTGWDRGSAAKEFVRLASVMALGPRRFLGLRRVWASRPRIRAAGRQ